MTGPLGQQVRDTVSGFTGIAVARTEWLHGCIRITIQPPVKEDGEFVSSATFDEPQIEVVEEGKEVARGDDEHGGPLPFTPTQHATPGR